MAFRNWLQGFATFTAIIYLSGVAKAVSVPKNTSETACCQPLSSLLLEKVLYSENPSYTDSLRTYYAGQEGDLQPDCIIRPESAVDVSVVLKVLGASNKSSCQFAIRGGGHTPFAGSANIPRGVTIDLGAMNTVSIDGSETITSVGGGARWVDVYQKLDPLELAVSGGRSDLVGVGGLTTGGGISFFSPRRGFVCDNVMNYEIVLANGTVLNVNRHSHPDLMKALRGGSNNFGVITRFDLNTFQQGKLWGGDILYDASVTPQLLNAFVDFGGKEQYDEYAALFIAHSYISGAGQYFAVATPVYTKPVANPLVFTAFTRIQPQLTNSMRIDVLGSFTNVTSSAAATGQRNAFVTVTFENDLSFLTEAVALWTANAASLANVSGLTYTLLNQHLLPIVMSKTANLGGNSLGLDPREGTLILSLLSITWADTLDDETVMTAANALIKQIEDAAQDRGVYSEYKYLNYANAGQAVFDGYGKTNKAFLQAMSRVYDPHGLFQRAVPGGFKLFTDST